MTSTTISRRSGGRSRRSKPKSNVSSPTSAETTSSHLPGARRRIDPFVRRIPALDAGDPNLDGLFSDENYATLLREFDVTDGLIPSPADQDRYAQLRRPMDMMVHG